MISNNLLEKTIKNINEIKDWSGIRKKNMNYLLMGSWFRRCGLKILGRRPSFTLQLDTNNSFLWFTNNKQFFFLNNLHKDTIKWITSRFVLFHFETRSRSWAGFCLFISLIKTILSIPKRFLKFIYFIELCLESLLVYLNYFTVPKILLF